jgi:hypothetical protein
MVCSSVRLLVGIVALVLLPESYRLFGSKNLLFVGNPIFSLSFFAVLGPSVEAPNFFVEFWYSSRKVASSW